MLNDLIIKPLKVAIIQYIIAHLDTIMCKWLLNCQKAPLKLLLKIQSSR